MSQQAWLWIAFNVLVAGMLYIDLFLASKKHHAVGMKEAAIWSVVWVGISLLFCGGIAVYLSTDKAIKFLTGYLIEKSLSVDNMFVFIMIFSYFKISPHDQPRVLKWGILGALVMRFILIFIGAALIERFHWIIYVFGGFLIYTAWHMAFGAEKEFNPATHPVFKRVMNVVPLGPYDGDNFFTRIGGRLHATPLFLAIVVVEVSDLVFALDSIPAIFAITTDQFLVYTSNVFAILGLRALYFLLAGMVGLFAYLKHGVAAILAFVGVKMLISHYYHISTQASLGIIAFLLMAAVVVSLVFKPKES
jgi:tellurite resistance protein TerC